MALLGVSCAGRLGFHAQTGLDLQGPWPRSQALAPAEDPAKSDAPFSDDEGGASGFPLYSLAAEEYEWCSMQARHSDSG